MILLQGTNGFAKLETLSKGTQKNYHTFPFRSRGNELTSSNRYRITSCEANFFQAGGVRN